MDKYGIASDHEKQLEEIDESYNTIPKKHQNHQTIILTLIFITLFLVGIGTFLTFANDLNPILYGESINSTLPVQRVGNNDPFPKQISKKTKSNPIPNPPKLPSTPISTTALDLQLLDHRTKYHTFSKPPNLIPKFNHTLHEELKKLEIYPFPPQSTDDYHRLLLNTFESIPINIADPTKFGVNSVETMETQGSSTKEKKLKSELNWISWSHYLDLLQSRSKEYNDELSPSRRQYQKQIYHARYATHISLDTNPPTIRFESNLSSKSFYSSISPIKAPIHLLITDPLNRINSTNPFYEYLAYNSTKNAERYDAVRREIAHSMTGYSMANFGGDEFFPISQTSSFHWGFGLTIVDALDTLILAENEEHVENCIEFIANKLKFTQKNVSLFEVTIRGLGGLLSAYSLRPEHTVLLERAVELGELLLIAFEGVVGGFPANDVNLGQRGRDVSHTVSSQILTLQIEFETLARYTGEYKYCKQVRRLLRAIHQSRTPLLGEFMDSRTTQLTVDKEALLASQQSAIKTSQSSNQYKMEVTGLEDKIDPQTTTPLRTFDTLETTQISFTYYVNDPVTISIGAMIDSSIEYYIKLWVLHGKPPHKLPLRQQKDNKNDKDSRQDITWLGKLYTPSDQDRLWDKFHGLYDENTGVYIPLHLYYEFIQKFPTLLQKSATAGLLFSSEIKNGRINPKLGHLDCFMGGAIAFGLSHGVVDDIDTMNNIYKAECVDLKSGIPCDFVHTSINNDENKTTKNEPNPFFYSHIDPNVNPRADFVSVPEYVRSHHQSWASDLTHTCVQTYGRTVTGISPEVSMFNLNSRQPLTATAFAQSYSSRTVAPEVEDLYQYFRYINTLPSHQQTVVIPVEHYLYTSHSRNLNDTQQYLESKVGQSLKSTHWTPPGHHWSRASQFRSDNTNIPTKPMAIPPLIEVGENNVQDGTKPPMTATQDINTFSVSRVYLLRPETVESLYYLWKTTRHQYYRDSAWAIFLQIVYYCRIFSGGYTTLINTDSDGHVSSYITQPPLVIPEPGQPTFSKEFLKQFTAEQSTRWHGWGRYHSYNISHENIVKSTAPITSFDNSMTSYGRGTTPRAGIPYWENQHGNKLESWMLAETLKYLLLTFDDDEDKLPLHEWVFNTEAHPVRR